MIKDRTKLLWGVFLASLVAMPALASDERARQVNGCASCATECAPGYAARWSDELPDNTDGGWNDVPFNPDKFWNYLRSNGGGA